MNMNGSSAERTAVDHSEYWQDDFLPLQDAGKTVLKVLRKDETSPHGDLYRRLISTPSTSSSSSSDAESIPNHHYFFDGKCSHVQSIPLPAYLQDQLAKAKANNAMGLFEQAQMAWMFIDDTVYLWSYSFHTSPSNEFIVFRVPSHQSIVSVGLAPPKPGVFREMVEGCLVVTTRESAMLCALARKPSQGLHVVRTKFTIPSDWVSFLSVASTSSGRIFLGGQDGNVYELDYDLLVKEHYAQAGGGASSEAQAKLDQFYDGSVGACPAQVEEINAQTSLLTIGKRIVDHVINPSHQPPRKCRKLNHTQTPVMAMLPDFVQKVSRAVFGDSTTTGGGPIIQMVVDAERDVLYTLSTRGWICALDIAETPTIRLAAVLNTPATARTYLELVSRGRTYAPSSANSRDGLLTFPGGGETAQAGVGGMDGARSILRMVEQAKNARKRGAQTSLLTPVSIQVVPNRESSRITLLAVTAGGLRYYLSSLTPSAMSSGPSCPPFGTPRHRHPWRPHTRLTFCHVRAPAPLVPGKEGSQAPTLSVDQRLDASCYRLGTFVSAATQGSAGALGSAVIATSPDSVARVTQKVEKNNTTTTSYLTPGGVCEVVSYPLAIPGASNAGSLPGGRVWDICPVITTNEELMSMALRSKTPSDTELGYSLVPAYAPPTKRESKPSKSKEVSQSSAVPSMRSSTFEVMMNIFLNRSVNFSAIGDRERSSSEGQLTQYRLSNRSGAKGFSVSAADIKTPTAAGSTATRSARLSPWLLAPDTVALNPLSLQSMDWDSPSSFVALNAGGLHFFRSPSQQQQLSAALVNSGANARTDPAVTKFFENYGYAEGCCMCFTLAMKPSTRDDLKTLAMRAALSRAYMPTLMEEQGNDSQPSKDPWVPRGYSFKASAIYEGLTLAVARTLRPFWFKPVVVVTEGRLLRRGAKTTSTPTKVELLFSDEALQHVLTTVHGMLEVIEQVFTKAVEKVPLAKKNRGSGDQMDIDDDNHFLMRSLEFQRSGQARTNTGVLRASEADAMARNIEERNIHGLFRLVSRTSQLLSLLSHLRRAHLMPDLPEVNWGQLHGVTFSQFVQTREGHERLESVLNSLVASKALSSPGHNVSADAKKLAQLLSDQCYHFFSPGSQFAYLGFQAAHDALSLPSGQESRRAAFARDAVENLKQASRNWFSAPLVTGRLLQTSDDENYKQIAERAIACDSPLARACALLVELKDVASLVEICLLTASNFMPGSKASPPLAVTKWQSSTSSYEWEKGLYHLRQDSPTGSSRNSTAPITPSVTSKDAVKACYALIFYYLTTLLNAPMDSPKYLLGERMVSVCAASDSSEFLNKFYEYLCKQNFTDVLLRVDSPSLEKWLSKGEKSQQELLLRYYQVQKKYVEAGDVALGRATDKQLPLTLDERIENLVYAIDSFSRGSIDVSSNQGTIMPKLKQSQELLDIARLQRRVLQAMGSTKYEVSEEDTKPLAEGLVSANTLLNDFALPYDLYEYCVLLLHVCRHTDILHVQRFWKSLLFEEVLPCATRSDQVYHLLLGFSEGTLVESPLVDLISGNAKSSVALFEDGAWMKGVSTTVTRLGRELLSEGESFVFPVDFIMQCLDELRRIYSLTAGASEKKSILTWAYDILVAAGVGHLQALSAYERLIERDSQATMGVDNEKRLEQIQTFISMLESFVSAARSADGLSGSVASDELKRACVSGSLSSKLDEYKARLQGFPGNVSAEEGRIAALEMSIRGYLGNSF
eukprot:Nitzschia sp. Nitz4//scaffold51_size120721//106099//111539//NITZ4_003747-RA/size120721-snap-gene-0.26-mRNA-1//1//CDS//3329553922//4008//frame0